MVAYAVIRFKHIAKIIPCADIVSRVLADNPLTNTISHSQPHRSRPHPLPSSSASLALLLRTDNINDQNRKLEDKNTIVFEKEAWGV